MLRNYLNSLSSIDVVLLQEHKLRIQDASNLGKAIWPGATTWPVEASVGYNNLLLGPGAGKGSIIILVAPRLASMVTRSSTILNNRAQWITIQGLPGGEVGIVKIYAPNDSYSRCLLWEALIHELPQGCRWIFGGDFNMVEI